MNHGMKESDGIQHVLLTRLNLTQGFGEDRRAVSQSWLDRRLHLFERLALPAIRGQDYQDFLWILLASDETPEPYRARMLSYAESDRVVVQFVGEYSEALPGKIVREYITPGIKSLLTSRIDNDDVVSPEFLGRLRVEAGNHSCCFINWDRGYRYDLRTGRLYEYDHDSNPFISLLEPLSEGSAPLTVLGLSHTTASSRFPIHHIVGARSWVQVLHEGNMSNRPGEHRRVSRTALSSFAVPGVMTGHRERFGSVLLDRARLRTRQISRGLKVSLRGQRGR